MSPLKLHPEIAPALEEKLGQRGPGGKPPTGGGGGDSWNDRPQGSRGPRERLIRYRVGLATMLGSSMVLFLALVSAFFFRRNGYHVDIHTGEFINDWHPIVIPPLLWVNTA